MTNERNAKTEEACNWLGHVLTEYVTGDWSTLDIAEAIGLACEHNLARHGEGRADEFAGTLLALRQLHGELIRVISWTVGGARGGRADLDDAVLTWEQIGQALGMTRQAAQQRYGD